MRDKNDMNVQTEVETKEEPKDTQVWLQFHMEAHTDSCLEFHK